MLVLSIDSRHKHTYSAHHTSSSTPVTSLGTCCATLCSAASCGVPHYRGAHVPASLEGRHRRHTAAAPTLQRDPTPHVPSQHGMDTHCRRGIVRAPMRWKHDRLSNVQRLHHVQCVDILILHENSPVKGAGTERERERIVEMRRHSLL